MALPTSRKYFFAQCVVILLRVTKEAWCVTSTTPLVRFEAAFQGECGEDSPCEQLCFDLHDGTYECSCRKPYILASNGYSCTDDLDDSYGQAKPLTNQKIHEEARRFSFKEHSNHVHRNNRFKRRRKPAQRTFSTSSASFQVIHTENTLESTTPLDDISSNLLQSMNTVTITTLPSQNKVTTCEDLKCDNGGECEIPEGTENARCMCPLGKQGMRCDKESEIFQPKFHGRSFLAFSELKDVELSVLIVIEFRPESFDGLLLYSGEKSDDGGDYMAILLNKGFVTFRFDCGSGESTVRSSQPVILYSWNKVSIYRERWDAWMQLNNGKQVHGQSQGLHSKLSIQSNLYLGGIDNQLDVKESLETENGFQGCISYLKINDRLYNFSLRAGDVLDGFDVDECDIDGCSQIICLNGGKCVSSDTDEGSCVCALGFTGELCETAIEVMVPSFNNSFLQYDGLRESVLSFLEIFIVFKPYSPIGAFLYNGDKLNNSGDFIAINLIDGHVEFRFDLGTGPVAIRSSQPVTLREWHTVHITRTGRQAILKVDDQRPVFGLSPGAFTQLTLSLSLFLGGIPDISRVSSLSGIITSFSGCMQKFLVNGQQVKLLEHAVSGRNIANCKHPCIERPCYNGGSCQPDRDSYNCKCPSGYQGINCQIVDGTHTPELEFQEPTCYYHVHKEIFQRLGHKKLRITFRVKTSSFSGLILWIGQESFSCSASYLLIGIIEGKVQLFYRLEEERINMVNSSMRIDDARWHDVHLFRVGEKYALGVDNTTFAAHSGPDFANSHHEERNMESTQKVSSGIKSIKSGIIGSLGNFTASEDCHVRLVGLEGNGLNFPLCT